MTIQLPKITVCIALIGLAAGCDSGENADASPKSAGADIEVNSAVLVETAAAKVGPFSVQGKYSGEFSANRSAEVAFEVSGRLVDLDLNIGDRVDKNDVLAEIAPTTYRQKVREARAAVDMARASVGEAEVAAKNLEAELDRKRPLLDQELISAREIEDLEARHRQAVQKVHVSRGTLDQNKARLQTARENLRHTRIRAPFDGCIAARHVDLGSYVGPTQPVFRLVSDQNLYLTVNVPEQDTGQVAAGKDVTVRVGALGGSKITGQVLRVAPAIDPATRMLRVDVELTPTADQQSVAHRIRPGMYAQVQMQLGEREQAVTIPKQALLEQRDGSPYVWRTDDGKANKRSVLIGLGGPDRVEVLEGLDGGDTIVLRGFDKLEPGANVQRLSSAGVHPLTDPAQPSHSQQDSTDTDTDTDTDVDARDEPAGE